MPKFSSKKVRSWASRGQQPGPLLPLELPTWALIGPKSGMIGSISGLRRSIIGLKPILGEEVPLTRAPLEYLAERAPPRWGGGGGADSAHA